MTFATLFRRCLPMAFGLAAFAAAPAHAFTQETHRRIVLDAVAYMAAHPTTTNYAKLVAGAARAGYTIDQFAAVMGQGAYDVDSFADTYISAPSPATARARRCGAWAPRSRSTRRSGTSRITPTARTRTATRTAATATAACR